jgi:hypothetical protein
LNSFANSTASASLQRFSNTVSLDDLRRAARTRGNWRSRTRVLSNAAIRSFGSRSTIWVTRSISAGVHLSGWGPCLPIVNLLSQKSELSTQPGQLQLGPWGLSARIVLRLHRISPLGYCWIVQGQMLSNCLRAIEGSADREFSQLPMRVSC